jgi:hypothetical protein
MAIVFSRGKAMTQPLSIPVAEPTDDLRIIYSTTLVHGILTGNIGFFGFFKHAILNAGTIHATQQRRKTHKPDTIGNASRNAIHDKTRHDTEESRHRGKDQHNEKYLRNATQTNQT